MNMTMAPTHCVSDSMRGEEYICVCACVCVYDAICNFMSL